MTKKNFVLLLAIFCIFSFNLLANGSQEEDNQENSSELVINCNLSDPVPREAFSVMVEGFKELHPDINVTVNTFDHESYKTAIRNFLTSDAPDVATWFGGNRMNFFASKGLLLDISDLWKNAGLDESMSSSKATLSYKGVPYGVAHSYYQWGVFYRKDILEKFNLSVPENWDDFLNVCATLKENDITPITIGTKYLWTAAGWFDYLNLRINGYKFHMDLMNGQISYNDPQLDKVFDVWADLIEKGYFLENHATYSWQEAQAPFINGQAAMYLIGNFMVPDIINAGIGDELGFMRFPTIEKGKGNFEDAPMDCYIIPAKAKNIENAKLFLEYASSPEVSADFAYAMGTIPPNKNCRPPEDKFAKMGFELLNDADALSQFYDRDTDPELASTGMAGFQEFMVKPEREKEIREKIEADRLKVFK